MQLDTSGFGRFIPDNLAVSYNTPQFTTACAAGPFTYVGQNFTYGTAPVITVTARNGTNNGLTNAPTTNYAGAYMKFSNAAGTSLNQAPYNTQTGRYSRFDALGGGTTPALDTTGLPATTSDPVIGTFNAGLGTLTFGSGTGLAFTRSTSTPNAPFSADIALTLNVIDTDGVAAAGPASFGTATSGGGITFNSGNNFRFGRLRLIAGQGSELAPFKMQTEVQYWDGTYWRTNTADSCTSYAVGNFAASGPPGTSVSAVSGPPGINLGYGSLTLAIPSAPGTETICMGLLGSSLACTGSSDASLSYLLGNWGVATYDRGPRATVQFGGANSNSRGNWGFLYRRENF